MKIVKNMDVWVKHALNYQISSLACKFVKPRQKLLSMQLKVKTIIHYSWLPVTWTIKGNLKRFELSEFELVVDGKKWPEIRKKKQGSINNVLV